MTRETFGEIHRAAWAKWFGKPPGLPPDLADLFMERMRVGKLVKDLVGAADGPDYICSYARFKKHCELQPEWGTKVSRLNKLAVSRKKSEIHPLRKATMCRAGLHPMVGDNVRYRSRGTRVCVACIQVTNKRVTVPLTVQELERIKSVLLPGQMPINQIYHGRRLSNGKFDRSVVMTSARKFYHAVRTDADFSQFIASIATTSRVRGQKLRVERIHRNVERVRSEQAATDYFAIMAMIPSWLPEEDKFDVVNDVLADLVAGKIGRCGFRERARAYVREIGSPKYRKFGAGRLLSLDAPAFSEGSTPLVELVSGGLWD